MSFVFRCAYHGMFDAPDAGGNRCPKCGGISREILVSNPESGIRPMEVESQPQASTPSLVEAAKKARLKLHGAHKWIEGSDHTTAVDYDGSGMTDGVGMLDDIAGTIDTLDAALAEAERQPTVANCPGPADVVSLIEWIIKERDTWKAQCNSMATEASAYREGLKRVWSLAESSGEKLRWGQVTNMVADILDGRDWPKPVGE